MNTPTEYEKYLASPHWKETRRRAIGRAGHRCQECGAYYNPDTSPHVRLQVHHLTYVRVGKERPEDLVVLCKVCHEKAHGLPEELTTAPGPESFDKIAARVLHFAGRRPPRQNAG